MLSKKMLMFHMQFIGITAVVDAILVIISLIILYVRSAQLGKSVETTVQVVKSFQRYLIFMFFFLIFIALAMLMFQGRAQMISVMVADIFLWIGLAYMVMLMFVDKSPSLKNVFVALVLILGFVRTLWQLTGILNISLPFDSILFLVSRMDVILMYGVWVPAALVFLVTAFSTSDMLVRIRSSIFAVGLLLTTYSWIARLQLGVQSLTHIAVISIIGFALLLGGILYKRAIAESAPPIQRSA